MIERERAVYDNFTDWIWSYQNMVKSGKGENRKEIRKNNLLWITFMHLR